MNVSRTPETLTAAERAAQLGIGGGQAAPARKVSASQVRALATQAAAQQAAQNALNEPRPGNAAADMKPGDEYDGSIMEVAVDKIEVYEKNPRTGENPRYEQIRESIRIQGVTNQLTVTQRPGKDTYVPYGGGNTRLRIVKELWKETADERWRSLTVRYRAWPGDAAVIAAHLAENESRGDTTFWEKAQGVASLKIELERESSRVLTAPEVNAEARRLGMDFGLKTVQDFLFAADWLRPIGPRLQADMVRYTLRPAITSLSALCDRFGHKSASSRAAIDQCLSLAADASAQTDAGAVPADASDLVRSLHQAIASLLDVGAEHLGSMLAALSANPTTSAKELRASVAMTPMIPTAPAATRDESTAGALAPPAQTEPEAVAADQRPAAAPPAPSPQRQMPLQPAMLAPVSVQGAKPAEAPQAMDEGNTPDDGDPRLVQQQIFDALMEIAEAAQLQDVICRCDALPLGYFVELPRMLHMCDDVPVTNPLLRKASWHVLAAVSGQYDEEVARRIPANESTWGQLLQEGRLADPFMLSTTGQVLEGRAYLETADLLRFFNHPELGRLFIQLWSLALRIQQLVPQRFPQSWQPLSL